MAKKETVNYLDGYNFEEYEWLSIARLAEGRGFKDPRARQQSDRSYVFMSGLSMDELSGLVDEVRSGGWAILPGARKRHFFRKPGAMFENPSLCNRHELSFHVSLDYDDYDFNKCVVCLRKYERLGIVKVYSEGYSGADRLEKPKRGVKAVGTRLNVVSAILL